MPATTFRILRFVRIEDADRMGAMSLMRCTSTLGCPELTLEEAMALATMHWLDAIEVRALAGTVDLPAYFAATYGTPGVLAERLREAKVQIAAFNASLHLTGATEVERDQLVALVPWAEAIGVKWLRVFDGGQEAGPADLSAARETMNWWTELRARHGWQVNVIVETHGSLFTAERLKRFIAAIPHVAILWDAHHTWRKGGEDPEVTWAAIRRNVVHVHVKDSIDVPSARHPFTYVLPGDGGFPIGRILAALQVDAFNGFVSLEWEKLWHPYLPSLEEALSVAQSRRWW